VVKFFTPVGASASTPPNRASLKNLLFMLKLFFYFFCRQSLIY